MKNNVTTIGVDPGSSSGAIAILRGGDLHIHGMKGKTEKQLQELFLDTQISCEFGERLFAVIERVSAMKGQGVSSTFKFGMNYGFLRGCLVANRIPFRDFIPKEWQKHYSMSRKKTKPGLTTDGKVRPGVLEPTKAWKTRLLNVAQNLYPKADIPLYSADAVLMAHFAKDIYSPLDVITNLNIL